ncbi:TonB-dependent receptor plug domain-containing protein [Paludibaculum fermentans]|uniref:TonB-dependent receptor plug domain-containing protein n=1 Tax=Paludibaculum fermentans TaxID=1473598 RepID=UPI003EB73F1C
MRSNIWAPCALISLILCPRAAAQSAAPLQGPNSSMTVTANRGSVEETATSIPLVYVRTDLSAPGSIDRLFASTPEVTLQNTTPGQASPALRSLTGYQTLLMLDGVRLNTAIFRSGPNQYSAFVDPSQVSQAEVLLGPASSAYGSDAMGGAIHYLSLNPEAHQRRFGVTALSGSGDLSGSLSPRFGWDTSRFAVMASAVFRRHNDVRTGGGVDTHNVFTRYAGYSLEEAGRLLGGRLPETAYSQAGVQAKFIAKLRGDDRFTAFYQRGAQYGLRSYRELYGGLGRLQARYEPQGIDLLYGRYERARLLGLERAILTVSMNRLRDDSRRQGVNYSDAVIVDRNSVAALGLSGQASRQFGRGYLVLGGLDFHRERISSYRSSGPSQFPDGALYSTAAPFVQATAQPFGRLLLQGGLRFNHNSFLLPKGQLVPNLEPRQNFSALAANLSGSFRLTGTLELLGIYSEGFRAPNASDLAATGLTGLGFEVPAAVAAQAGALLALDASEAALPRDRRAIASLGAERLRNFEAGLRLRTNRWVLRLQGYSNFFDNPIVRRTVLFDAASAPAQLSGIPVSVLTPTAAQRLAGVVTVATAYDPRAVKAFVNDGAMRFQGVSTSAEWRGNAHWMFSAGYSYSNGREILPNRTPRRLPPQQGVLRAVWTPNTRVFAQFLVFASGAQEKLSAADLDDERIGASRSRRDIQTFFQTPVGAGTPISGTVRQLQDQLLPLNTVVNGVLVAADTTKVPLYTSVPAWVRCDANLGLNLSTHWKLSLGLENLGDANYRTIGSGADALGRSVVLRSDWRF